MTDEHEHAMKVWREAYVAHVASGAKDNPAAAVIAADRAGLVAEIERLWAMIEKLAGYAEHDEGCQIMTHGVWSDPTPCTCGYSDVARAALKDTRHD